MMRGNFASHERMRHRVQQPRDAAHECVAVNSLPVFGQAHSMNVTLLISFKVVMPWRTLARPASRRKGHARFLRGALDFRSGPAIDDHFANMIRQVQQFGDCGASVIARARTFQASRAIGERNLRPERRDQSADAFISSTVGLRPFSCNARRRRGPGAGPECSSARKRNCTARRPC